MDKEKYYEELAIANFAANYPGIDIFFIRHYLTGETPEIELEKGGLLLIFLLFAITLPAKHQRLDAKKEDY